MEYGGTPGSFDAAGVGAASLSCLPILHSDRIGATAADSKSRARTGGPQAAVVSIRRNEGSRSVWQVDAMRFESLVGER